MGLTSVLIALTVAVSLNQPPPVSNDASADGAIARAKTLAGDTPWMQQALILCDPAPNRKALEMLPIPAATPVLDNLYYLGTGLVSAWLLQTDDGYILIDTLDNEIEARDLIQGGMAKLGLPFDAIRYIVVTHGHRDHVGGLAYLKATLPQARVVMTDAALAVAREVDPGTPLPDIEPLSDMTLKLGKTSISIMLTPGHSPGTVSLMLPVMDHGHRHKAVLLGGSASSSLSPTAAADYIASTRRIAAVARRADADVIISNHPLLDGTAVKLRAKHRSPPREKPICPKQAVC